MQTTALVRKAGQELAVLGQAAKAEIAALTESEIALAKTAEGLEIVIDTKTSELGKVARGAGQKFEMSALDKVKGASKAEASLAASDANAGLEVHQVPIISAAEKVEYDAIDK